MFQKIGDSFRSEGLDSTRRWLDHEVSYSYDFLRRVVAIQTREGSVTYSYDQLKGQIQRRLPNGITTTSLYGLDGKLLLNSLNSSHLSENIVN